MRFEAGLRFPAEEAAVVSAEGRVERGIDWQLTEEEYAQVAKGYRCLHCMEPFAAAFPDKCPVCGFHVKEQQTFELARQHRGTEDLSVPSPNMRAVQEEREREAFVKRTGIWLPGDN